MKAPLRVGILGGGQLARMLIEAGAKFGFSFRIFSPHEEEATRGLAETIVGAYDDERALAQFAAGLDCATYEFENLSATGVQFLESKVPVFPPPRALAIGQDRAQEKTLFQKLGIPTTRFQIADSLEQLGAMLSERNEPAVIKTTRLGYDGKGQLVYRSPADSAALKNLGKSPFLVENLVPFKRELSVVGARGRDGAVKIYPLVENLHREGILRRSIAPAPGTIGSAVEKKAHEYFNRLTTELNYCGVLAIEFFEVNGDLIANEIAPRVHNTGHWTIEGSATSQFENHLRAIAGLPLGDTSVQGVAVMLNLIGTTSAAEKASGISGAHVHLYGKTARPGRKVGHITITAPELKPALEQAAALVLC